MPKPRRRTAAVSAALSTLMAGAVAAAAFSGSIPGWRLSAADGVGDTATTSAAPSPQAASSSAPASVPASAGSFATMGNTGAGAGSVQPSASPLPGTGKRTGTRTAHDIIVSGLPSFNGGPAIVPPTVSIPSMAQPWPASTQWQFTDDVPGVTLSGVQHYVGTSTSGVVVLPTGAGEPHLLCSGNENPLAAYFLDNSNGQWSVSRYDGGTKFDFYYRWVRGYYLQTAPCS